MDDPSSSTSHGDADNMKHPEYYRHSKIMVRMRVVGVAAILSLAAMMTIRSTNIVFTAASSTSVTTRPHENATRSSRALTTSLPTSIDRYDEHAPKVAWLMSYPNSGTTFTMNFVRQMSNRTTADNYGNVYLDHLGKVRKNAYASFPLYAGDDGGNEGPFLFSSLPLPDDYILTKTHCGGYPRNAPPQEYVMDTRIFLLHCRSGVRFRPHAERTGSTWDHTEGELEFTRYNLTLIHKSVHLIRNPFDNIVSRFHHEFRLNQEIKNEDFVKKYPFTKDGFQAWCRYWDTQHVLEEGESYEEDIWKALQDVPCHAEFYKYVQWHNNAFRVSMDLQGKVETMVVMYDDFSTHFFATCEKIFSFLNLEVEGSNPVYKFISYRDFYDESQIASVTEFVRVMADPRTWFAIKSYLQVDANDVQ